MGILKSILNFSIFTILIASLILTASPAEITFADDESEKKQLEKEREQAKKENERLEEEQKKVAEKAKEDRTQLEEKIKKSLKLEFDKEILQSGNIADWILVGTIVLIFGVVGTTGYKIMKRKKREIMPTK